MAKKLQTLLIVDLEATCWAGSPPTGQVSDIIEIGVCEFDTQTLKPKPARSLLVRPERSRISEYCTTLTTLTQHDVDSGLSFAEASQILRQELDSANRVWASYGDYDRRMFERQCSELGVNYPFGATHLNVKTMFALSRGLPTEIGMAQALELEGVPLTGTHHRGHDDAWNIAGILARLLQKWRG